MSGANALAPSEALALADARHGDPFKSPRPW
jgi:hypothetical protein